VKQRLWFESGVPPPGQPETNGRVTPPALIEGTIPLPATLCLRSRSWLAGLDSKQRLSAREVAWSSKATHAGILTALDRLTIPRNENGHQGTGNSFFGFDCMKSGEQATIRMVRRYQDAGLPLRAIAGNLDQTLRPTEQNGIWQANTVTVALVRA
jgi:hypothetical protein